MYTHISQRESAPSGTPCREAWGAHIYIYIYTNSICVYIYIYIYNHIIYIYIYIYAPLDPGEVPPSTVVTPLERRGL